MAVVDTFPREIAGPAAHAIVSLMLPRQSVALAFLAAVAGGVAAVGIGTWAGWLGGEPAAAPAAIPTATLAPQAPTPAASEPAAVRSPVAFDAARIYRQRSRGVVTIDAVFAGDPAAVSQGSGFVVATDGTILTSAHVITDAGSVAGGKVRAATRIYVVFDDRDRVAATIVGWDVFSDVGVLKVDPRQHALIPVPLGDSAAVRVGDPVAAIGSPFGNEGSLSVGVVSATRRSIASLTSDYNLVDAIQTDATINHGNSGGPLFDSVGRVIGISAQIRSSSGAAEGVGFAVPIDAAQHALRGIIATGHVRYAFVGIRSEDLTPSIARVLGYPVAEGAVIDRVDPATGAAAAGLRGGTRSVEVNGATFRVGGDVIIGIAGRSVRSADDVARIVATGLEPGQVVPFTVLRGKQRLVVKVRLGERAPTSTG